MLWSITSCILTFVVIGCLLATSVTDFADRIIPNTLVVAVLFCGIGLRVISGPSAIPASLLWAVGLLIALGFLASHDLVGFGDVKLIAAVTIAVPPDRVPLLLFAIALAGGILSCLYLTSRFALRHTASIPNHADSTARRGGYLRRLIDRERGRVFANEPMPYALAIVGGFAYRLATE